ncbi:DNA-directed DNA polymerase X [Moorella glycerini]|uniref:DNA polymerase beta n=1 Tax=Neomoorella stamsii TaxID=1266720 RepID=A0A9X7P4W7_9FIRM|nr:MULTISPECIES: PHP domain-containing protein [Moorella]PRR69541.1 DNA polymerase/3'-5' exonuclease PolX [Moorella stamsii]CEP68805.1 DNA-directed DNA polymerase X [Moorella glycerini]
MTNLELAWALTEMGDLLELKGEEPFKVRAYHRAARALENLEEEAAALYARDALEEIPGVGKNLAKKIAELLTTGRSTFLENLRREVPPGLREMLAIPGLGSRSIRQIHQALGITTLEELETAAREKRIRTLPGMGSKTELAILRGVEMLKEVREQVPLGVARPLALLLRDQILLIPGVERVAIAGSVRRGREMVGDVDLVVAVQPGNQVADVMTRYPHVKEVLASEPDRLSLRTTLGVKIEIILVPPGDFAATLFYATGSKAHRRRLISLAASQGLGVADLGLVTPRWLAEEKAVLAAGQEDQPAISAGDGISSGKLAPWKEGVIDDSFVVNYSYQIPPNGVEIGEPFFYRRLGLPYIVPELREDRGEIEAALRGELPRLITLADIRGDLHMHSRYSDGVASIAAMAAAAQARGYQYIAITDHSRSLVVARGLSVEQLKAQREEIARLNEELEGITILAGIEVDILADGRLDYEDDVLKEFDLVIASIHSGFRQEEEQVMARLEAALRHPYVDILGHPTGRMLGRRRPYAVNVTRIIELAAATGTILEINASPDRLDLNDTAARLAREYGVPIAINTDAHDPNRLADMEYGVLTARRGWLEPENVVNTWELELLLARLKRNR